MTFSAEWLQLRRPADDRARSARLVARALEGLRAASEANASRAPHIVDLGAGTGATLAALAPSIARPHRWTLVDADASLLRAARPPRPDVTLATRVADLAADPLPLEEPIDLVTASALFDLMPASVIAKLADRLAARRLPLLALLTYDGTMEAAPAHPADDAMLARFNAHQRSDKGAGRAAGPDAVDQLADALERRGHLVDRAPSPWRLTRADAPRLLAAMIEGWAGAALEIDPAAATQIERWRRDSLAETTQLTVGHADLYAAPGGTVQGSDRAASPGSVGARESG